MLSFRISQEEEREIVNRLEKALSFLGNMFITEGAGCVRKEGVKARV